MSHDGNGPEDFEGLERLRPANGVKDIVEQARIEARDIIDRLEPRHIASWPELIMKLEYSLEKAKRNAEIFQYNPVSKE